MTTAAGASSDHFWLGVLDERSGFVDFGGEHVDQHEGWHVIAPDGAPVGDAPAVHLQGATAIGATVLAVGGDPLAYFAAVYYLSVDGGSTFGEPTLIEGSEAPLTEAIALDDAFVVFESQVSTNGVTTAGGVHTDVRAAPRRSRGSNLPVATKLHASAPS